MIDRLVSSIHDAALEPEAWPDVLGRISRRFDAAILLSQVRPDRMSHGDLWSYRFDLAVIATMPESVWHTQTNRTLRRIKTAPIGLMSDRRAFLSDADMDRDFAGRHFFKEGGLFHAVVGTLQRDDEALSCFTLGRSSGAPEFERDEVRRIRFLAREIGRAMRMHRALRRSEMRSTVFSAAIDRLSQGVILTDGDLRVLHANATADSMLETGDAIRRRHGRLALRDRVAHRKLEIAARALAAADGSCPEARLFARRGDAALPYSLRVLPAIGGAASSVAPRACVIVLLDDPELALSGLTPERLAADFGLTAAEARVAALAAETIMVGAIAERLRLSVNTVKTHLRAIYGKVGVRTEAGLVRQLVARIPPRAPETAAATFHPHG